MKATVNKWGNSLGIRLPKKMSEQYQLKDGAAIELIETKQGILIQKKKRLPTIEEIVKSYPKNYKPENLIPNDLSSEQW